MDSDPTHDSPSWVPSSAQVDDSMIKGEHNPVEVMPNLVEESLDYQVRLLRAWGSVGIMGLLAAWVILNAKQ